MDPPQDLPGSKSLLSLMDDDSTVNLETLPTRAVIPFGASHTGKRKRTHDAPSADIIDDDRDDLGGQTAAGVADPVASMQPDLRESATETERTDTTDVFFRISHTQLGRHKFFDKGAVATHDLAIQIIPVLRTHGAEILLDMSVDRSDGGTKLTTWMSESAVSFEELRSSWKVWKTSQHFDTGTGGTATGSIHAAASHSTVWDVNSMDLQKYIPSGTTGTVESVDILGDCRRALSCLIGAAAFPGSEHSYISDETEEMAMNELDRAGLVVCELGTYKLLHCILTPDSESTQISVFLEDLLYIDYRLRLRL